MDSGAPPTLLDQARSLERSGDWAAAAAEHSRAFRRAVEAGAAAEMVDAVRGGARVRHRQGRHEEAEELALLSERLAVLHGLARAAARALNVRAMTRFSQSDLEGARRLYGEALEQARHSKDDELIGLVCQNLGVIANIQGNLPEARALYLESVASSVRSGDRTAAIMAYNNLGLVCCDLGDWLEAELYFDRGIDLAERLGHLPMLGCLHLGRAEPLIHMGELVRAHATLDRAEEAAGRTQDREVLAAATRFRGILARLEGDHEGAEGLLRRALAAAEEAGLELQQAEALGGIAHLRRVQGCPSEARDVLASARRKFEALGARRELARLDEVLARWDEDDAAAAVG
jgi:tetratricopeptide (TPR) repeat protein